MANLETQAFDVPDQRDYTFEDFLEYAEGEGKTREYPEDKMTVFNQGSKPSCTMHAGIHCVNALNLNEDRVKGYPERIQINPDGPRHLYCAERGDFNSGSAIQTVAYWLKKKGYIEGYVSIGNNIPLETMQEQVDRALNIGVIYTGSAWGDWAKIKKTGIYTESSPRYFLGHAWDIMIKEKVGDYYKCMNSYGENWGPYKGYFLLHRNDLDKIYSKIIFIDKDDSELFKNFAEIQKVKQAIDLLRGVYHTTENNKMRLFLEKIQMGKNFSEIYGVQI